MSNSPSSDSLSSYPLRSFKHTQSEPKYVKIKQHRMRELILSISSSPLLPPTLENSLNWVEQVPMPRQVISQSVPVSNSILEYPLQLRWNAITGFPSRIVVLFFDLFYQLFQVLIIFLFKPVWSSFVSLISFLITDEIPLPRNHQRTIANRPRNPLGKSQSSELGWLASPLPRTQLLHAFMPISSNKLSP